MDDEGIELEPGEKLRGRWRVEPVGPDGSVEGTVWLVLTDRTLRIYPGGGLLSRGRIGKSPTWVRRLEGLGSVDRERYELKIGYGDRVLLEGLSLEGTHLRFPRGLSAVQVRAQVEQARRARREELERLAT